MYFRTETYIVAAKLYFTAKKHTRTINHVNLWKNANIDFANFWREAENELNLETLFA